MANDDHVTLVIQQHLWNDWRQKKPDIRPDLSGANLRAMELSGANFSRAGGAEFRNKADLSGADLRGAHLYRADLSLANLGKADLSKASLTKANLSKADLRGANLSKADLRGADLRKASLLEANLMSADLRGADLREANLRGADFRSANLSKADLSGADLIGADLREADLSGANLKAGWLLGTSLVGADLTGADLTGCRIHGVSAWDLKLEGAKQQNLVITPYKSHLVSFEGGGTIGVGTELRSEGPEITVDNIEVAQFIYLLLHNEKIRDVIEPSERKAYSCWAASLKAASRS